MLSAVVVTLLLTHVSLSDGQRVDWVPLDSVAGVVVCLTTAILFRWLQTTRLMAVDDQVSPHELVRRVAIAERSFIVFWIAMVAATLFAFDWVQFVRSRMSSPDLWLMDEIMVLAPFIGSLWITGFVSAGFGSPSPSGSEWCWQRCWKRAVAATLQLSWPLVIVSAPFLLIVTFVDHSSPIALPGAAHASEGIMICAAILVTIGFPWCIRFLLPSPSLRPGRIRDLLHSIVVSQGVHVSDFRVWLTQHSCMNAFVVGSSSFDRAIYLSDRLIAKLSLNQLGMIVRHEVAHITRNHIFMRISVIVGPASLCMHWTSSFPVKVQGIEQWLLHFGGFNAEQLCGLVAIALVFAAAVSLGLVSRLLEFDADVSAVLPRSGKPFPNTPADHAGCDELVEALMVIRSDSPSAHLRSSWLHPSIDARIRFLRRVQLRPVQGVRFQRVIDTSFILFLIFLLASHVVIRLS